MAFTIRSLKIRDQILLVTLPPLFVLLCAVALFFYAYWSTISTERSAVRSEQSVVRSESFLRHATEASVAVRGYVYTYQKDELAPYDKAVNDALADLIALNDLEAGNPGRAQEVSRMRTEFDQLQRQWALPTIEKVRTGENFNAAAALVDDERRMDTIRSQVLKLRKEDEGETVSGMVGAEMIMRRMLVVGVGLAVLLAGVLVFLTGVVTRLIVVPVLQLIRASEQVGHGDFCARSASRG